MAVLSDCSMSFVFGNLSAMPLLPADMRFKCSLIQGEYIIGICTSRALFGDINHVVIFSHSSSVVVVAASVVIEESSSSKIVIIGSLDIF